MRHANKQDKDAILNIWTQCFGADMRYQNILTAKAHRITTDEVAALCHALKMDVADFFQDDIFKDAVA